MMGFHQNWVRYARPTRLAAASILLTMTHTACREESVSIMPDDTVTIVVKSDDKHLLAEKAALAEQRKYIQQAKAQLEKSTSLPNCASWKKLLSDQDDLSKKQDKILRQQDAAIESLLKTAEQPVPIVAAPADTSVNSAREIALAKKEKEIAAGELAVNEQLRLLAAELKTVSQRHWDLSVREKAVAACEDESLKQREAILKKRENSPTLARSTAEKAHHRVLAIMQRKGVLPSDLPPSLQKNLRDASGYQRDDLVTAMAALESLESWLNSLTIDRQFVASKTKRMESPLRDCTNPQIREKVESLLQQETGALTVGDYREANRLLNNIFHLLEQAT